MIYSTLHQVAKIVQVEIVLLRDCALIDSNTVVLLINLLPQSLYLLIHLINLEVKILAELLDHLKSLLLYLTLG